MQIVLGNLIEFLYLNIFFSSSSRAIKNNHSVKEICINQVLDNILQITKLLKVAFNKLSYDTKCWILVKEGVFKMYICVTMSYEKDYSGSFYLKQT